MKHSIKSTTVVHLELNIDEVRYLRDLMQNPIITDEPAGARELRESLFNVCKAAAQHGIVNAN